MSSPKQSSEIENSCFMWWMEGQINHKVPLFLLKRGQWRVIHIVVIKMKRENGFQKDAVPSIQFPRDSVCPIFYQQEITWTQCHVGSLPTLQSLIPLGHTYNCIQSRWRKQILFTLYISYFLFNEWICYCYGMTPRNIGVDEMWFYDFMPEWKKVGVFSKNFNRYTCRKDTFRKA